MKLIMTLLVRDEEDIIQENIEYHLSQGVDFFIATDNLSVDSTSEILREYERKGVLYYIYEDQDDYSQYKWVTRMARMACNDFGADWIINNDADEFWWPQRDESLKAFFKSLPGRFNVVSAQRHNFIPLEHDGKFYENMIYREKKSLNHLGKPLPPKAAHRGHPEIEVHQGNHLVSGFRKNKTLNRGIEIFHFPVRQYKQFVNKIKKGGAAYERNRELKESVGDNWRRLYQDYKKNDGLEEFYNNQFYDSNRIAREIESGKIQRDPRLRNYFLELDY